MSSTERIFLLSEWLIIDIYTLLDIITHLSFNGNNNVPQNWDDSNFRMAQYQTQSL
jgi:hypothetical protein